jgi:hypothetical protein
MKCPPCGKPKRQICDCEERLPHNVYATGGKKDTGLGSSSAGSDDGKKLGPSRYTMRRPVPTRSRSKTNNRETPTKKVWMTPLHGRTFCSMSSSILRKPAVDSRGCDFSPKADQKNPQPPKTVARRIFSPICMRPFVLLEACQVLDKLFFLPSP